MMSPAAAEEEEAAAGWEMRPGGLLVQKRKADPGAPPAKDVRVRVSYGAARYEVSISSLATFGELKKLLTAETGLQPAEQRLLYRGKERGDGQYLDVVGVRDRSKVALVEDPTSLERRLLEMRRNARIQSARRAISDAALELDRLADQVTAIEKSISKGNKVAELQITTVIELLMRQAVKLDSIPAEGDDAYSQKNLQILADGQKLYNGVGKGACHIRILMAEAGLRYLHNLDISLGNTCQLENNSLEAKRVQKCVETLDALKIANTRLKPVVVTTKWETFDPPTTTKWEFFD